MQNNIKKDFFEMNFDKQLCNSDAFSCGPSVILCDIKTAQKLLSICNEPPGKYKGHDIYVSDFDMIGYSIFPCKLNLKRFKKFSIDCSTCKYGKYNDIWNIPFCYNDKNCENWELWEAEVDAE